MPDSNLPRAGRPAAIPFLINLGLSAVLFAAFHFLPLPAWLPCTDPLAEDAILAIGLAAAIQTFALKSYRARGQLWVLGLDVGLIALLLWLGIYPISPLGFSSGRIPIGRGFVLTRSLRPDVDITSGEQINVVRGSVIAIKTVTLPVGRHCFWLSTKGGALDDSGDCDIDYMPPADSNFDLLKVLIQPACHLAEVQENLKVVILP